MAEPVGDQADADDAADDAGAQARARVQAQPQPEAADQRAEVEVEGIADEGRGPDAAGREPVAGVAAAEQVEAAVERVAQRRQAAGQQHGAGGVAAQRAPGAGPVDVARARHQQREHEQREARQQQAAQALPLPCHQRGGARVGGAAGAVAGSGGTRHRGSGSPGSCRATVSTPRSGSKERMRGTLPRQALQPRREAPRKW